MSETNAAVKPTTVKSRHRSRFGQIPIFLGKQLRFFINESDWKVIPMSAVIAGLVAMVIRKRFFIDMEGGLMSAFALTCVGIWNGCFNSIQSICRERAIIKREHRSGMKITSYIAAHMIYQFLLCLIQTVVTMYVLRMVGIQFPKEGFITRYMMLDIGISLLLISYASDMLSLFVSSIAHTTTGAMTVMPFVLIFQLVFSGSIIPLPEWSKPIANFTISNYGIRAIAAQSNYNELPMTTPWKTVNSMRNQEITATVTLGDVLNFMNSDITKPYRDTEVLPSLTLGDAASIINSADKTVHWRDKKVTASLSARDVIEFVLKDEKLARFRDHQLGSGGTSVGDILKLVLESEDAKPYLDKQYTMSSTLGEMETTLGLDQIVEEKKDQKLNDPVTLGQIIDFANGSEWVQGQLGKSFTVKTTLGQVIDYFGEDRVKELVTTKSAEAARIPEYDRTRDNIYINWFALFAFMIVFALGAAISLKFIDKDKR